VGFGYFEKGGEFGICIVSGYSRSVVEMIFKVFFILKYIKIIFFYFLKIIFNIVILKRYENIKKILN
jgi:hypothetical protein